MANAVLLEARSYRPFKSSEEYLYAMREDLAEWLNMLYPDMLINTDNFMDRLDTGVALCKHAHNVRHAAEEYLARRQARNKSMTKSFTSGAAGPILAMGNIHFLPAAKSGTFFARDNVSNFIAWCRKSLQIFECLLFETDDLIMRKNEKHVILCLLEVARRGAKFGMLAPMLVQMERQIDREIAADNRAAGVSCDTQTEASNGDATQSGAGGVDASVGTDAQELFDSDTEDEEDEPVLMYGPQPQIVTNDLKSLDEMVRDLVEKCTCPSQFPMVRVSEGKYRIGDTKVLIFVRILRSHVMVRVGGGWDTLSHYLDKHDPCRCKAQHRSSVAARLITRTNQAAHGGTGGIELHKAQVLYERSPTPVRRTDTAGGHGKAGHGPNGSPHHQLPTLSSAMLSPPASGAAGGRISRSPTPQRRVGFGAVTSVLDVPSHQAHKDQPDASKTDRRSVSPAVHRRNAGAAATEFKSNKQHSLDSNSSAASSAVVAHSHAATGCGQSGNNNDSSVFDAMPPSAGITDSTGDAGKFENISDNGSEISDEGYRSLGLIQGTGTGNTNNINNNRLSLISQTSADDAEINVRLDVTTSSDSQTSTTDEPSCTATTTHTSPSDGALSPAKFAQSGVFVTDDHISIDITQPQQQSPTPPPPPQPTIVKPVNRHAPRHFDEVPIKPLVDTHIPRSSPMPVRRKSIDSSSANSTTAGGHPHALVAGGALSRKIPAYRSMRKPATVVKAQPTVSTGTKDKAAAGHTWSGRAAAPKKRTTLGPDTFSAINRPGSAASNANAAAAAGSEHIGSGGFNRNSAVRASQTLYDRNGRRVQSTNTSPTKSLSPSPLAQQILEAAGTARNDSQMLEKMKRLLSRYTTNNDAPATGAGDAAAPTTVDDFTTAWVNSNGTLDRVGSSSSCSGSPVKMQSKRSSAASSVDSAQSRELAALAAAAAAPRPNRGTSRIPAPIRQNTVLY